MGRDGRKNGEQRWQICADRPPQSDVVRLLGPTSRRAFIKETSSDQSLVDKGKSTGFQLGSDASNKHNGEPSSNESQGG